MNDEDGYFGEGVAARYDETDAHLFDPAIVEPTVDFLADRTGGRRVLGLGIGTGRIAPPLAARGVEVSGIELDLMAELAGMRLRERWACWKREPFTSESRQHISVWEKPTRQRRAAGGRRGK